MFAQMLPWLLIALLFGIVVGLIAGTHIGSSLLHRHVQATQVQTRPLGGYQRIPSRYLDDDPYGERPRRS